MKLKRAVVALSAAVVILSGAAQAVPRYSVTYLGSLSGGMHDFTSGINASGQVVGDFRDFASRSRAFLSSGGSMTDLGTLGGNTTAGAINDLGQVVGSSQRDPNPGVHGGDAFLYSGGIMTALGTINGRPIEWGYDINASGQVAASYQTAGGQRRAVLYSGGAGVDLGTLVGDDYSVAMAINDNGQVAGTSQASGGTTSHAFLYSGGVMTDLGTLGGNFNSSRATDINDSGQVVGLSSTTGAEHVFLYSNGVMTDIGMWFADGLPKINNSGQILSGTFLYSNGIRTELNDLLDPQSGWSVGFASDINDAGQIAASGCNTLGVCGAVLLSPVPEPEIYLMMLAGLGLVGMKLRRRNSIQQ